ncbi:MAG TPA: acetoin utilization protein AcuC [Desulfuromonas sp.]|nr:acetoin utilization protein AcuC [Desulfuromonas sp.]
MSERCAFVYSSRFDDVSYGDDHPFKVARYRLAYELIRELELLAPPGVTVVESPLADEAELLRFHRADYLEKLREFSLDPDPRADFRYGLGDIENPVFPGLYAWARTVCGGTLEATRRLATGEVRSAFNMAGGWHHAHAAKASGFSYLNDAVVAIQWLVQQGLRVAYVDIDAHHGDGVQEAFYDSSQVLTISLHETGDDFFPHTGYSRELGHGPGYGYAVNIPFLRHADDRLFRRAFDAVVMPLLKSYRPDVLVSQFGVDSLRTDPLTRLEMTTAVIEDTARTLRSLGLPWLALGGGGYDKVNVACSWALVWGVMSGRAVPDTLPPHFRARIAALGAERKELRDDEHFARPDDFSRAQEALESNLAFLSAHLSPIHRLALR